MIDNKKMWESIFRNHPSEQDWINICDIKLALKAQGLTVNDKGEIVSIEPECIIEEGKWYMCVCTDNNLHRKGFYEGKLYQVDDEGYIKSEYNYREEIYHYLNLTTIYFRPATEEEILKAKFDSPELPEIVKEQVREITEKPTVSWDSVNGTMRFDNLTNEQAEKLKNALIGEPNEKDGLTEFEKIIYDAIKEVCNVEDARAFAQHNETVFNVAKRVLEKQGEQKPAEWHREDEQNLNACLGFIPDEFLRRWLKDIIHVKYDKPAWSEEDDEMLEETLYFINEYQKSNRCKDENGMQNSVTCEKWLQSLKYRVLPKPMQEWSEEDKGILIEAVSILENYGHFILANKLKSLRPQKQWKPSDEQIEALECTINYNIPHAYGDRLLKLEELLKNIKTL